VVAHDDSANPEVEHSHHDHAYDGKDELKREVALRNDGVLHPGIDETFGAVDAMDARLHHRIAVHEDRRKCDTQPKHGCDQAHNLYLSSAHTRCQWEADPAMALDGDRYDDESGGDDKEHVQEPEGLARRLRGEHVGVQHRDD